MRPLSIRFVIVAFCLFGATAAIFAQSVDQIVKGKLIERVPTRIDVSKTYALYLPSGYSPDKKWPVVYIFDPVARGAFAAEKFRAAAEKYGYILVGSNDSRNGLDLSILRAIFGALWQDTHERFLIDEKRSFAAGFSGGARVATVMATTCNGCFAGVILSGAGYLQQIKPTTQQAFAVFAAAGVDDFNLPELIGLDDQLEELKRVHRFEAFEGIHQWMPEPVADDALAWLLLLSMKMHTVAADDAFISAQLRSRGAGADKMMSEKRFVDAKRAYRSLVEDFTGLADVTLYSRALDGLIRSDDLKRAQRSEREQILRQSQFTNDLLTAARSPSGPETDKDGDHPTVSGLIAKLNKMADSASEDDIHLAKRTLAAVYAITLETAQFDNEPKKQFDLAIVNLELAAKVNPRNPYIRFELAKAYALDGQKKRALSALDDAAELGFSNLALVESEPAFAAARGDERYAKVLDKIKTNAVRSKN